MAITIEDKYFSLIKGAVGYPMVDETHLDDNSILNFAVFPALQDYFRKFPIKERKQYSMGGTQETILDFPDDYTFGALDIRVTDAGIVNGTGTSFWDLVYFQQLSGGSLMGSGSGAYGIKGYNPSNIIQTRDMQRAAYKSYQNTYMTLRYEIDEENKKIHAYSTVVGYLNVIWAKYSDNFAAVKFARKMEVIKLAQSYLLTHFANTYSMITDTSLDVSINTESLKDTAQKYKDEIKELWDSFTDVIFLHSS